MKVPFSGKLSTSLVQVLARRPLSTVHKLSQDIAKSGKPCTHQAIYKELAKLQKQGVVVKLRDTYSLTWTWIVGIGDFAEETRNTYLSCDTLFFPRKEGERFVWQFHSLPAVDDFWGHLFVALLAETKESQVFEWIPHPWFELIHESKEDAFRRALRAQKSKIYMCVGGDRYLDRLVEKRWHPSIYQYSFAKGPFHHLRNVYFDVIGDYILSFSFPKAFAKEMDSFYQRISGSRDLEVPEIFNLITRRTPVKVSIELNKIKSAQRRNALAKYFGVRVKNSE